MTKKEISLCIFFFAISVVAMVEAFRLTVGTLKHPGPGFVPMIASAGILVSCLVVLFQAKNTPKGNDKNPPAKSKDRYKVLILIILLLIISLFLVEIGYPVVCFLAFIVMLRLLEPIPWIKVFGLAAIIALISSILFNLVLNLDLPRGIVPYGFLKIFY